ncbi:MAG: lysophospholipid acyltransferase family protein [Gammaproteobacteria bacterium]|jgi:1-acyl-sn-glycerol-3-phosphate acyltransferase
MIRRVSRIWRAFATGFCFVVFGVGCAVVAPTALPVALLYPGNASDRQRRVRALVGAAFRGLLRLVALVGMGRVQAEGLEHLRARGPRLILASHPTFLDVVVLIALHPQADCVVKSALWRNPFTRAFVRAAGYISNAEPEALIDACVEAIQSGGSLVIFPEGTRSTPGTPLNFKRGAARIALRSRAPIVPVLVACAPPAFTKEMRWYQVPVRPWRIRVKALPARDCQAFTETEEGPLSIRVRQMTDALQDFFRQQLVRYELTD